jgi:hypothetical protein
MEAQGLDLSDAGHRDRFTAQVTENFFERISGIVRRHDPKLPLFFNSGHIRRGMREHYRKYYSHLELESLPTAGWGYDHFPLSARYVDPQGIDFIGMTGKFHYHWGEVGGYKKPEALVYECGAMLAQGAHCSIGDHLHPTGAIDQSTMRVIAPAYKWVAEREAWAVDTVNRAQVALLSVEAMSHPNLAGRPNHHVVADEGAVRVLLEGQFAFDVVDAESDFSLYRLLILPDVIAVEAALQQKIEAFVAGGGRVLLTGRSGIDPEKGFVFDVGGTWHGTSEMAGGDYLLPVPHLRAEGIDDPLFMYKPSEQLTVTDGTGLGEIYEPYFDRRPQHFSGHVNAPSKPEPSAYAAGVEKGGYTYFAHPIFTCYYTAGAVAMLEVAEKLVARALGEARLVTTSLPRAGRVTVRRQQSEKRDVVHLLHATPALRGNLRGSNIQPIQDLVTLADIEVSLGIDAPVKAVKLVPEGTDLAFRAEGERVAFTVPAVRGHQMVEVKYE